MAGSKAKSVTPLSAGAKLPPDSIPDVATKAMAAAATDQMIKGARAIASTNSATKLAARKANTVMGLSSELISLNQA